MKLNWEHKINTKQEYYETRIGMDILWVYTERGKTQYKGMY